MLQLLSDVSVYAFALLMVIWVDVNVTIMTYAERMKTLQQILTDIQRSEDVDNAIVLYEKGLEHVRACEERITAAAQISYVCSRTVMSSKKKRAD